MYLVKGLRSEYYSITDTWDVHNLSIDTVKRDLRQKGMRIESRAQSQKTEPPTPTAFAASHDDATTEILKRQVSKLQDELKSLQGATTTRRASYGTGAARIFRGVCCGCDEKGHRMSECPDNNTGGNSAHVDSPVAFSGGHGRDGHPCEAILRGSTHVRARWKNVDVVGRQRRQLSHD
jgi:hypothetical protein